MKRYGWLLIGVVGCGDEVRTANEYLTTTDAPDVTAPAVVSLTAPGAAEVGGDVELYGTTATFEVTLDDDAFGGEVVVEIGGAVSDPVPWGNPYANDCGEPCLSTATVTVDTSGLPEGAYTATATVTDFDGNEGTGTAEFVVRETLYVDSYTVYAGNDGLFNKVLEVELFVLDAATLEVVACMQQQHPEYPDPQVGSRVMLTSAEGPRTTDAIAGRTMYVVFSEDDDYGCPQYPSWAQATYLGKGDDYVGETPEFTAEELEAGVQFVDQGNIVEVSLGFGR